MQIQSRKKWAAFGEPRTKRPRTERDIWIEIQTKSAVAWSSFGGGVLGSSFDVLEMDRGLERAERRDGEESRMCDEGNMGFGGE